MATINFSGVDEMIGKLGAIGRTIDEYAPGILKSAAGELEKSIKGNINRIVSPLESSGEMLRSVKTNRPYKNKNGVWKVKVGFRGKDSVTGTPNDLKAMLLEYGSSRQRPRPFIGPAEEAARGECLAIIRDGFNKILG